MPDEDAFDPWWREALCAQVGSDLFFLKYGEPGDEAKKVCRLCPVRTKCLADAALSGIEHGIFGGFGRDARRRLTARIEAGEDPMTVAEEAITEEETREGRSADHRGTARGRRDRDRLRARAGGREEERPAVAAQRPGAVRQ